MLFRKRTAMNLLTFLATAAASFVLVIGRRWAVKSVAEIYDQGKMGDQPMRNIYLTFDFQGSHPTNLGERLVNTFDDP